MKASDNNSSRTVYDCFYDSIQKYGVPLHVRGDRGSENALVRDFMLNKRGEGAYIDGRSVHNQRIERLWVDVGKVVRPYYNLFHEMEDNEQINSDNLEDIESLHQGKKVN